MQLPTLRFKGYTENWKKINFFEHVSINSKLVDPKDKYYQNYPHIGPANIEKHTGNLLDYKLVSEENLISGKFEFGEDDIVYGKINPQLGKVVFPKFKGLCSADTYPLSTNSNFLLPAFLFQHILTPRFLKYTISVSMRTGMPKINREELAGYTFNIPSLKEQKKISDFFSLLDRRIKKQRTKVEALQEQKKGLLQKIFSQELRFRADNGKDFPEWNLKKLKEIVSLELRPVSKPSDSYVRLGLKSHAKGTFHTLVDKPEDVSMDTLYLVKESDLIVNITFAWEHAIAIANKNDENKLVSHRFPTYTFNQNEVPEFYKHRLIMRDIKHLLGNASPGGAGRNRVLNKKDFLNIPLKVPSFNEQRKIADFLYAFDQKVEKESAKLESLQEQKKGFMQQMFI
jgi:type I restriction enzyme, S subunit